MALRIARRGAVGVATHPVPCTSQNVVQNSSAFKTKKVTSTSHMKSFVSPCVLCGLIHAKSSARIGCWNIEFRTLGSLGDQSTQLCSVIDTMKSKHIDVLALSE